MPWISLCVTIIFIEPNALPSLLEGRLHSSLISQRDFPWGFIKIDRLTYLTMAIYTYLPMYSSILSIHLYSTVQVECLAQITRLSFWSRPANCSLTPPVWRSTVAAAWPTSALTSAPCVRPPGGKKEKISLGVFGCRLRSRGYNENTDYSVLFCSTMLPVDTGTTGTVPENRHWDCWLQPTKKPKSIIHDNNKNNTHTHTNKSFSCNLKNKNKTMTSAQQSHNSCWPTVVQLSDIGKKIYHNYLWHFVNRN